MKRTVKIKNIKSVNSCRRNFLRGSGSLLASLPLFGCASQLSAGSSGSWFSVASMPYPVQEIYPALLGNSIHVAGGFAVVDGKPKPTNRHIAYSIADDAWSELRALPEARHHVSLVNCANKLYALGGFAPGEVGTWNMQGQTWRYDQQNDQWQALTNAPELHAESVSLAKDNLIHVIGGRTPKTELNRHWGDHIDSNRHLVFDAASNHWNVAAPAINARNSAAGCVIGDYLYVAGGRTVAGGNLAALEVYDAKEDRWFLAQPLPEPQGALAAAEVNGELIAFGGESFGGPRGVGVYSEAWRYNPVQDAWLPLPAMQTPRHGLGAVAVADSVYAIGGATYVATNGTSPVVEVLKIN